jgi:DNA (cytosine-5)-methyltransferase 1
VLSDLEGIGYSTQTFDIPACAVDAPHVRHRIWIVANAKRGGCGTPRECGSVERMGGRRQDDSMPIEESGADVAHADRTGCGEQRGAESVQSKLPSSEYGSRWLPEPELGRVAHGIPRRVDRLRSLGNAVVPAVVEIIGRGIMGCERICDEFSG